MTLPYSGPQLIFLGMTGETPAAGEGVCRVCGGPLLLPAVPHSGSDDWTDESICVRRDATHHCCACHWFMVGSNRSKIWQKKKALVFGEGVNMAMDVSNLPAVLASELPTPCVIMVAGRDSMAISQKHQQWRTAIAVTTSRRRVRVALTAIQLGDSTKVFGVAEFEADAFVQAVMSMADMARSFIVPTMVRVKTKNWQKELFSRLLCSMGRKMNRENYLAAFVASHVVADEAEEGGGDRAVG